MRSRCSRYEIRDNMTVNVSSFHTLNAVIDLFDDVRLRVCRPISACLRHDAWDRHNIFDRVGVLQYHPVHARAQMPRNMAMQRPDALIVLEVLDDDIRVCFQHLHIAALWIFGIDDRSVPASSRRTVALLRRVRI